MPLKEDCDINLPYRSPLIWCWRSLDTIYKHSWLCSEASLQQKHSSRIVGVEERVEKLSLSALTRSRLCCKVVAPGEFDEWYLQTRDNPKATKEPWFSTFCGQHVAVNKQQRLHSGLSLRDFERFESSRVNFLSRCSHVYRRVPAYVSHSLLQALLLFSDGFGSSLRVLEIFMLENVYTRWKNDLNDLNDSQIDVEFHLYINEACRPTAKIHLQKSSRQSSRSMKDLI